jgi:glycosyltransferase involved in cell wall biosynthesis
MRVAVVHNLPVGGARRRLANQLAHLDASVVEICLETATPITSDPVIIAFATRAPLAHRLLRPPLRYLDLGALEIAWRRVAERVRRVDPDIVYLNPCQFIQGPPVVSSVGAPTLYFCDEPRRVDSEAAAAGRNPRTAPLYAALYRRLRHLDRSATIGATQLVTNSRYSAAEIHRVYGRSAEVIRLGVEESLLANSTENVDTGFLLSVGALIQGKGHDLAIRTAALAREKRDVVVVSPRPNPAEERRLFDVAAEVGVALTIRVGIDDEELGGLFRTAHATLYLARREPLGLVSLEAQACGSPVIVAAEGGLPETIVDGVTGWQSAREPRDAAEFLDRLDDSEVREAMSRQARLHGRRWSWRQSALEIETLLRKLSGEAVPSRAVSSTTATQGHEGC